MWTAELTCWSSLMRTTVPPSWSAWPGMIAATSTSASHPSQNEGVPMDPSSMSRRSASEPTRAWPKLWTSWSLSNRTIQAGKGFLLSSHGTLNLNDPIVETFFQERLPGLPVLVTISWHCLEASAGPTWSRWQAHVPSKPLAVQSCQWDMAVWMSRMGYHGGMEYDERAWGCGTFG